VVERSILSLKKGDHVMIEHEYQHYQNCK